MFPAAIYDELQEYVKEWQKAERAIKSAEYAENELNVASIVELRYAGRRFVELLEYGMENDLRGPDHIQHASNILSEARQNCVRARNDAIDVVVSHINDYFADAEDKYQLFVIREYFPKYADMRRQMFQIQDTISVSREKALQGRNELYDEIQERHLPEVVRLYRDMVLSEDLIQKDIEQARRKAEQERAERDEKHAEERRYNKRNQIITWSVAGVAAVIALGSLAVAILTYLWRISQLS